MAAVRACVYVTSSRRHFNQLRAIIGQGIPSQWRMKISTCECDPIVHQEGKYVCVYYYVLNMVTAPGSAQTYKHAFVQPIPPSQSLSRWLLVRGDAYMDMATITDSDIVTLTDYFTKWTEAAPLPDKCAAGVVKLIYSVMCHHGCPKVLITDQGREFVNEVSQELYSFTNTEHRITSAYHPQVCKPYIIIYTMIMLQLQIISTDVT